MTQFQKIARVYRGLALFLLNTVLVGVGAGLIFFIVRSSRTESPENPATRYGLAELQPFYPGRSPEEIAALLKENWARPLAYEPYTQFKEAAFQGRFVNVSEAGYRAVLNQGPWPPRKENLNIFVFGSSTTFGYGVADGETIASVLQQRLNSSSTRHICVYNFGRAHYYSSQERILFSNLLAANIVPDAVVFIDGSGEFYYRKDAPEYSTRVRLLMNQAFPVNRKFSEESMLSSLVQRVEPSPGAGPLSPELADALCQRYLRNREMIQALANTRRIKTVFVWQPVPTYKFDLTLHPFVEELYGRHRYCGTGYEHMARWRQTSAPATNELWLADMQQDAREPLYVDAVHYSPKMCARIADEIARAMRERLIVPRS